jgi:protein gp37
VMQNGRPNWTGKIRLIESRLDEPLRWKEPQRIFACSKTDLFH